MLAVDKHALELNVQRDALQIREKEMNNLTANFQAIGTQAALLAGFSFACLLESYGQFNEELDPFDSMLWIYYTMTCCTLGLELYCVCNTTLTSVFGSYLALNGPSGSMRTAVHGMRHERSKIFKAFLGGVFTSMIAAITLCWLVIARDEDGAALCTTCTIICIFGVYYIAHNGLKTYRRFEISASMQQGSTSSWETHAQHGGGRSSTMPPHRREECGSGSNGSSTLRRRWAPCGSTLMPCDCHLPRPLSNFAGCCCVLNAQRNGGEQQTVTHSWSNDDFGNTTSHSGQGVGLELASIPSAASSAVGAGAVSLTVMEEGRAGASQFALDTDPDHNRAIKLRGFVSVKVQARAGVFGGWKTGEATEWKEYYLVLENGSLNYFKQREDYTQYKASINGRPLPITDVTIRYAGVQIQPSAHERQSSDGSTGGGKAGAERSSPKHSSAGGGAPSSQKTQLPSPTPPELAAPQRARKRHQLRAALREAVTGNQNVRIRDHLFTRVGDRRSPESQAIVERMEAGYGKPAHVTEDAAATDNTALLEAHSCEFVVIHMPGSGGNALLPTDTEPGATINAKSGGTVLTIRTNTEDEAHEWVSAMMLAQRQHAKAVAKALADTDAKRNGAASATFGSPISSNASTTTRGAKLKRFVGRRHSAPNIASPPLSDPTNPGTAEPTLGVSLGGANGDKWPTQSNFASPNCKGELSMRTPDSGGGSWKKRYCVMGDGMLDFYTKRDTYNRHGNTINARPIVVGEYRLNDSGSVGADRGWDFSLVPLDDNSGQPWEFRVNSQPEKDSWIQAIMVACNSR